MLPSFYANIAQQFYAGPWNQQFYGDPLAQQLYGAPWSQPYYASGFNPQTYGNQWNQPYYGMSGCGGYGGFGGNMLRYGLGSLLYSLPFMIGRGGFGRHH